VEARKVMPFLLKHLHTYTRRSWFYFYEAWCMCIFCALFILIGCWHYCIIAWILHRSAFCV